MWNCTAMSMWKQYKWYNVYIMKSINKWLLNDNVMANLLLANVISISHNGEKIYQCNGVMIMCKYYVM